MRRLVIHVMSAGLALLMPACASVSHDGGPMTDWIDQHVDDVSPEATTQPAADTAVELPANAGPEEYVRLALARNPGLRAARERVLRLKERAPQESSLDDPMLEFGPQGRVDEMDTGFVGAMVSISQRFTSGDKRKTRGRIAQREAAMAQHEYEEATLALAADVRRGYWTYYAARQAITIAESSRTLLLELRKAAEVQYKSALAGGMGGTTQSDVMRAGLEVSDLEARVVGLRQEEAGAAAMLNSLMDRAIAAPLPDPAPADLDRESFKLDDLLARAASKSPELARLHERIAADRERLRLARLQRVPDLEVRLSYDAMATTQTSPNGADQGASLGLGINLPIWSAKLDAGEREALHGVLEGIGELQDASNRVAFRVRDAATRAQADQRQAELIRDTLLPQARQTLEASLGSYRGGKTDFLALLMNWRAVLDYQLMFQQTIARLERDYADLTQAAGGALGQAPLLPPPRGSEKK